VERFRFRQVTWEQPVTPQVEMYHGGQRQLKLGLELPVETNIQNHIIK
jgi:hypothetical protein